MAMLNVPASTGKEIGMVHDGLGIVFVTRRKKVESSFESPLIFQSWDTANKPISGPKSRKFLI
jgi:hypothetical protein